MEFNWFQYCDVSVLMLFHCSFNRGIEIEEGRGRPLQLISLEFFEDSWMTTSFVLQELVFADDKISSQQFSSWNYYVWYVLSSCQTFFCITLHYIKKIVYSGLSHNLQVILLMSKSEHMLNLTTSSCENCNYI